ncbi:g5455 [Coccomyxa elongata]
MQSREELIACTGSSFPASICQPYTVEGGLSATRNVEHAPELSTNLAPTQHTGEAARARSSAGASTSRPKHSVSCDFTLMAACTWELRQRWLPAKVDQVVQADRYSVCLRLRTSTASTPNVMPAASAAAHTDEEGDQADSDLDRTADAGRQSDREGGNCADPSIDPFMDMQQGKLPWPWLRSPPGSDKGALAEVAEGDIAMGWLWLCWDPQGAARISMGPPPERGAAAEAFSFGAQMAAELKGLVLLDVEVPRAWERVVRLKFGPRASEDATRHVYAEIQARYSNVVLTAASTDKAEKSIGLPILAAAHQVGALQSSERQLQVLGHYTLPPMGRGLPPNVSEPIESWRQNINGAAALLEAAPASRKRTASAATVAQALVRAYQGIGPALVAELCKAADVDPELLPRELKEAEWAGLFEEWRAWVRSVTLGRFRPAADPATGRISVLGSGSQKASSVHALVDGALRGSQDASSFEAQSGRLQRAVFAGIKRLTNKLSNLQAQLAAQLEAEHTRHLADLLTANLHLCRQGDASIEVEDWESGEMLTIQLDRSLPPSETAAAMYRTARKQGRTGEAVAPILEETEAQLEHLFEIDLQLNMLRPDEDGAVDVLKGIQEELVAMGVMQPSADAALAARSAIRAAKSARRLKEAQQKREFRRFTTPNGLQNNRENDRLSHEVAAKGDLWFHARGFPGSHTVLRLNAGSEPTEEDISFAADLAAFYSKARAEGKVRVVKTQVANLKKVPGAAPGKVMVMKEEMVLGQPDRALPLTLTAEATHAGGTPIEAAA